MRVGLPLPPSPTRKAGSATLTVFRPANLLKAKVKGIEAGSLDNRMNSKHLERKKLKLQKDMFSPKCTKSEIAF